MDLQTIKDTISSLNFKNHADIRAAAALPEILAALAGNYFEGRGVGDAQLLKAFSLAAADGSLINTVFTIQGDPSMYRIISVKEVEGGIYPYYYAPAYSTVTTMSVIFTPSQYDGLSVIQDAEEQYGYLPTLVYDEDGYLIDDDGGKYITSGGKKLIVTHNFDDEIETISISNVADPDGADIAPEDLSKLIGLPVDAQ